MGRIRYIFKDDRINERASDCFSQISRQPTSEFPKIFSDSADLEGFYRLLHNPRVYLEDLKDAVIRDTQTRLKNAYQEILVLHDTTEVQPPKAQSIAAFQKDGKFLAHVSLLTGLYPLQKIYGVGDVSLWCRSRGYKSEIIDKHRSVNELDRWWDQVVRVNSLPNSNNFIHVMDREADACKIWSRLHETGCRFVIRLFHNRRVQLKSGENRGVNEVVKSAAVMFKKVIRIGDRHVDGPPKARKRHPDRKSRLAHLEISAMPLHMHKSDIHGHSMDETLAINIVYVRESRKKKDPVDWMLMTTEPVQTEKDVLKVIEIYRTRWLVEEFFKGLKTGCRLEERLFADEGAWYRLFLFFLPLVTQILNLRYLCRDATGKELANLLTSTQWEILKKNAHKSRRAIKTLHDAFLEIARLGGIITSNGPPGWKVLLRGYVHLLELEEGWKMATEEM